MASNLGNKIIQITANSQGVKAGVDQAQRELDRLSGVASRAGREIDTALNKLSESGGRRTAGTVSNPSSAFDRFYRSPQFLANGREPLSRAIARTDFETAAKGFEQSLQAFAGLAKEFGIFSSVVKGSALKFRSAEAATEAAKDAQYRLASAINREVNAQNASLASRLASAGTRNGGSGIGAFRLTPLDDPDRSDANRILENIRSASATRRPIEPPPFSARRAQGELEEANKVRRDAYDREQAAKQIAETLEKQKRLEDEANRILAARNRVISGLASQRAAALADPDNLAALNRFERNRGLPVTAGQPFGARVRGGIANLGQSTRLGRFATGAADRGLSLVGLGGSENAPAMASQLFGGAATLASKAVGIVGGALAKVGGFVVTEFVNFVSRVAANLTSRLIASVAEGIVFLSGKALEAAKRYEDAVVSFGVLGGSPGRGAKLVDELQRLAIDTPFKFQEVLDESKLLLSYGVSVNDLTKRLRQLGDVASGTGVDLGRLSLAFGQVLAKGRLQGPEIRQFTEAGVGIRDFVSAFNELEGRNVSTQGFLALVEQGDVSAKVVERAFDRMTGAGGRFFNFMEVRSKTVSGRLNALAESFELVIQRVGKSVFDKFNISGAIDVLVKKLSGIDFKDIDRKIGAFAEAAVPFGRGIAGGIGELFEQFKKALKNLFPNQEAVRDNFRFLGEIVIPGVINIGKVLARLFLQLTSVVASFADVMIDVIEVLYPITIGPAVEAAKKLGQLGNAPNRPLLAVRNVALAADAELAKIDVKKFADGFAAGNINLAEAKALVAEDNKKRALGIPQVAEDDAKLKKAREIVKAEEDRLEVIRKTNRKIAEGINIQLANANPNIIQNAENPFRNFVIPGLPQFEVRGEDVSAFRDIANGDTRGLVEQLTGGSGLFKLFESISGQAIPKNLEEFNNALKEAAGKGIPNFNQRIEDISKIGEKTKDPVDEFKRNLQTIASLDTDVARRAGFGIEADAARRARGRLASDFIGAFKPEEIKPAQLVRAGSQEAEQALTRAIYEARNNSKSPEQQLADAIEKAEATTKDLNDNTERLATATEKLVDKRQEGFGFFLGLGFGQ